MQFLTPFALYFLLAGGATARVAGQQKRETSAACASTGGEASSDTAGEASTANADAATADAATNSTLVLPDGRIAQDAVPEDFNVLASVFKSAVVKGDGTFLRSL